MKSCLALILLIFSAGARAQASLPANDNRAFDHEDFFREFFVPTVTRPQIVSHGERELSELVGTYVDALPDRNGYKRVMVIDFIEVGLWLKDPARKRVLRIQTYTNGLTNTGGIGFVDKTAYVDVERLNQGPQPQPNYIVPGTYRKESTVDATWESRGEFGLLRILDIVENRYGQGRLSRALQGDFRGIIEKSFEYNRRTQEITYDSNGREEQTGWLNARAWHSNRPPILNHGRFRRISRKIADLDRLLKADQLVIDHYKKLLKATRKCEADLT